MTSLRIEVEDMDISDFSALICEIARTMDGARVEVTDLGLVVTLAPPAPPSTPDTTPPPTPDIEVDNPEPDIDEPQISTPEPEDTRVVSPPTTDRALAAPDLIRSGRYRCDTCDKRFVSKSGLSAHYRSAAHQEAGRSTSESPRLNTSSDLEETEAATSEPPGPTSESPRPNPIAVSPLAAKLVEKAKQVAAAPPADDSKPWACSCGWEFDDRVGIVEHRRLAVDPNNHRYARTPDTGMVPAGVPHTVTEGQRRRMAGDAWG